MHGKAETSDIISLETPLVSIVTERLNNAGKISLNLQCIIFKNARLYSLFKKFMDESGTYYETLTEHSDAKFDDNTKSVALNDHDRKENIIGKFFLETNLDWPKLWYETNSHFSPQYKQPVPNKSEQYLKENYSKGVQKLPNEIFPSDNFSFIYVPDSIIELMNNFEHPGEIKQVASLATQAFRTSPASKFLFFKQDWFVSEIAQHLEPKHDKPYAASKLKNAIVKSNKFQEDLRAPQCCIL